MFEPLEPGAGSRWFRPGRAALWLLVVAGAAALLWFYVFPWVDSKLPENF